MNHIFLKTTSKIKSKLNSTINIKIKKPNRKIKSKNQLIFKQKPLSNHKKLNKFQHLHIYKQVKLITQ